MFGIEALQPAFDLYIVNNNPVTINNEKKYRCIYQNEGQCKLFCTFQVKSHINLVGFCHFLLIFDGFNLHCPCNCCFNNNSFKNTAVSEFKIINLIFNNRISRSPRLMNWILTIFIFTFSLQVLDAACTGNSLGSVSEQQCTTAFLPPGCSIDAVEIQNVPNDGASLRTSFSQFPITFNHTGGPGTTYTARPVLSDPSDSGTSITESECTDQRLTVFFANSGQKNVQIAVFQVETNREVTSSNSLPVIYDKTPPEINILRVFVGSGLEGNGLEYSTGVTYYTSQEVFVRARVVDPAPSQSSEELGLKIVSGLSTPQAVLPPTDPNNPGLFEIELNINSEQVDGEYLVRIAGTDDKDGQFEDGSPANIGESKLIRVVRDTVDPIITRVELIKDAGTENQVVDNIPGAFIDAGRVRVRVTFSEPMQRPPTLLIAQQGNGFGEPPEQPIQATFDSELFAANPGTVEYEFAPLVGPSDTGPATFQFQAGGLDLAGNELNLNSGVLNSGEIQRAVIVDVNPPSLNRINPENPGDVQTIPSNNQRVSKDGFPQQITMIVRDYNLPDNVGADDEQLLSGTGDASGVDFNKIADSADQSTGNAQQSSVIKVEVTDPNSQIVPGTLVTQPPNGLIYLLPDVDKVYPDLNGLAPEGTYTVKVDLIDRVGNATIETFFFQVDNTDIVGSSIQVSLEPVSEPNSDFVADSDNPLLTNPITGREVPELPQLIDLRDLDAVNTLNSIRVCSTDPSFDLTRSEASFKARLNGPDTVPRTMNTSATTQSGETNACGTQGRLELQVSQDQQSAFPDLGAFPNPSGSPGVNVAPGSRDPRFGQFDGPYVVEVIARDDAGNISNPIKKEFLLDTTQPYTESTYPSDHGKINSPLRHISAVLIDPHPPRIHTLDPQGRLNYGSGINVERSSLKLFLATPYRESQATSSGFFSGSGGNLELRSKLSFTHIPNSLDPDKPSFDPKDDKYRVLLEFVDSNTAVTALPEDGSVDGLYRIESVPVDNAGNSVNPAVDGSSGWVSFGSERANRPIEASRSFVFLLDSIPPQLSIDGNPIELNFTGSKFQLSGKTLDLSAKLESPSSGGSGIDKVEYEMVYLTEDGELIPGTDGTQGKRKANPILTGQLAELSDIQDASRDPSTSSTKPLIETSYGNIELEERSWIIDGSLPPSDEIIGPSENNSGKLANYFLRIKSYDLAGNVTIRTLKVNLSLGELPAPLLVAPDFNENLTRGLVNFEWKPVSNIAEYILTLSRPDNTVTTFSVATNGTENVFYTEVLTQEGEYEWSVIAKDSVGNLGTESIRRKFKVDRTKPKISLLNWVDLSPESSGKLTIGQFKLQIHFSENIQTPPLVTFDPFGSSVGRQIITTDGFEVGSNLWQGVATIPETAAANWDGIAVIEVSDAFDAAGNRMDVNRSNSFEIDTGPAYSIKFFENPVYRSELVLLVVASEDLLAPPVILNPQGLSFASNSMLRLGSRVYSAVMKLAGSSSIQEGVLEISGTDLNGNSASRVVRFPIASVINDNQFRLSSSRLKIDFSAETFDKSISSLAILPPSEIDESSLIPEVKRSITRLNQPVNSELRKLRDLEQIIPSNVELKQKAYVQVRLRQPLGDKQGIFLESAGSIQWLTGPGAAIRSLTIERLGGLAIYEDRVAPKIEIDESFEARALESRSPKLTFNVRDQGSGIEFRTIMVRLAGQNMEVSNLSDGSFEAKYRGNIARGSHQLEIQASDRLGNLSVQRSSILIAGPIRMNAYAYPNPAVEFANIRYDLNRPASNVMLRLYDVAGRRIVSTDSTRDLNLSGNLGRNVYRLQLATEDGISLSNGTYLCQISVKDDQGRLDKKHLKIVVLR